MDFLRRHSISGVALACVLVMSGYVMRTAAHGREIRRNEKAALEVVNTVFELQEARRLEEGSAPYQDLASLLASPEWPEALERPRRLEHAPSGRELYVSRGYYFVHGLRQTASTSWSYVPSPDAPGGEQFRLMAWPVTASETGLVVYYADFQGYVFQGENESTAFSGPGVPLFELDPYRDLEAAKKGTPGVTFQNLPGAFRRKWSFIWELREDVKAPSPGGATPREALEDQKRPSK